MTRARARDAGHDVTQRKDEHLTIAAGQGVEHHTGTGLEWVRLRHRALPERDLESVATRVSFCGVELAAPLVISAMTGGTDDAAKINERLTAVAAEHSVALTLGSGRALLEQPDLLRTYRFATRPPLLLANLGAAQVARADGPERCERLVELLAADGLSIHLNPVQEAVQPEGEPRFAGVAERIATVVERLSPLPVVVKEVGFGVDAGDVVLLKAAGVRAIEVAGAGGTNWALIEGRRNPQAGAVAAAFADWGSSTVEALTAARAAAPDLELVASGGIRDGVELAKCLALGADAVGMARPLLVAAQAGHAGEALATIIRQLRIATWASGAAAAGDLDARHLQ